MRIKWESDIEENYIPEVVFSNIRISKIGDPFNLGKKPQGQTITQQVIGDKRYELANHLGNVLNVVTDRKLPVDIPLAANSTQGDGVVDYFTADVVSYSDYLPFGQIMPNRHGYTGTKYRFGFQKQEVDDEVSGEGNFISFKYRNYDPRIGRMWSIDPLASKYPFYSPYAFSGNRVIDCRELEGLEPLKDPDGQINDDYKPAMRLYLPNGDFVQLYQVHGSYAITQTDRNKIHSFADQGYSVSPKNNFDQTYTHDNGTTVNIQVGVDGLSRSSTDENNIPQWAKEGLFRVNSIQAPSQITVNTPVNTPVQQPFTGMANTNASNGQQVPATDLTNDRANIFGAFLGNQLNASMNNLIANSPQGANVINFQATVNINQNLTPDQQTSLRNSILENANPAINITFGTFDPTIDPTASSQVMPNSVMVTSGQVTATQTTTATQTVPTLQIISQP
jgi:RHS repeat-associated protein